MTRPLAEVGDLASARLVRAPSRRAVIRVTARGRVRSCWFVASRTLGAGRGPFPYRSKGDRRHPLRCARRDVGRVPMRTIARVAKHSSRSSGRGPLHAVDLRERASWLALTVKAELPSGVDCTPGRRSKRACVRAGGSSRFSRVGRRVQAARGVRLWLTLVGHLDELLDQGNEGFWCVLLGKVTGVR